LLGIDGRLTAAHLSAGVYALIAEVETTDPLTRTRPLGHRFSLMHAAGGSLRQVLMTKVARRFARHTRTVHNYEKEVLASQFRSNGTETDEHSRRRARPRTCDV
jgi:hypothetical protein